VLVNSAATFTRSYLSDNIISVIIAA